jgi:nitrate reductase gamma subunit
MHFFRTLSTGVITLVLLAVVAVTGVLIAMQVKQHHEEEAARKKLHARVVKVRERIADGYRSDGRLPTVPRDVGTPAVVSQNSSHAVVYAHIDLEYTNTVFMSFTDTVDECHLFILNRTGDTVRVKDDKVSCTTGSSPHISQAPHLTFAFMAGIAY